MNETYDKGNLFGNGKGEMKGIKTYQINVKCMNCGQGKLAEQRIGKVVLNTDLIKIKCDRCECAGNIIRWIK